MEQNIHPQQEENQTKENNMVLNPDQVPVNIEENAKNLKEQLSNNQNNSNNELNKENYPKESINENNNMQEKNMIPPNNLNPELAGNYQLDKEQLNDLSNPNNLINNNIPPNPQAQQFNDQIMYQLRSQMNPIQNNQDLSVNNYVKVYEQVQGQSIPDQMQYQQANDLKESKNIYDYATTKNLYGIAFQNGDYPLLAVSSLEKSLSNKIEILELIDNELKNVYEQQVKYPCTKLLWSPNRKKSSLLASSSDCIELYNYLEDKHKLVSQERLLNKKSKYSGALTSFDWNTVNDALLGTASVDTTCTIWDLNKASIKTQLIAHDKEVFDIQFGNDENTFISGGADGSVRLFDLRELNHSTIIYETKGSTPINKLAWNLQTPNLIAALSLDKNIIYIFDSRANTNVSMDELNLHKEPVTGIVWAPDNPSQLCSVSEDNSVIISNVHNDQMSQNANVSYNAPYPINNVDWCKSFPEWIGITFQNKVQLLRK